MNGRRGRIPRPFSAENIAARLSCPRSRGHCPLFRGARKAVSIRLETTTGRDGSFGAGGFEPVKSRETWVERIQRW